MWKLLSLSALIFVTTVSCSKSPGGAVNASDSARTALDILCGDLPVADITARTVLQQSGADARALRYEADAVAAVQSICDQRPIADIGAALKAAAAAFAKVVAAETAGRP